MQDLWREQRQNSTMQQLRSDLARYRRRAEIGDNVVGVLCTAIILVGLYVWLT